MGSSIEFPTAFDTSLSNNFANQSCTRYFHGFLTNQTFLNCHPMSFYLENSNSFAKLARQGINSLQPILEASCNDIDIQQCQKVMNYMGIQLVNKSNCGYEYENNNSLVLAAYNSFDAYDLVRQSTCLQINDTNIVADTESGAGTGLGAGAAATTNVTVNANDTIVTANNTDNDNSTTTTNTPKIPTNITTTYCYLDALYNDKDSSDAYLYLMPLGTSYPNTSVPSCSQCTQTLMNMFYDNTGNASSPISYIYNSAAFVINRTCSPGFIQPKAKAIQSSHKNSAPNLSISGWSRILLALILILFGCV